MAEIDKTVTITEQIYSTKKGPLDAKTTPADTYDELIDMARIPRAQRYEGLSVIVLNKASSGLPTEYWLVGGTTNACWKVKSTNIVPNKAALNLIPASACTVGLEMIVQADETDDNKISKYWVTEISNGQVIWTKKEYGQKISVTGDDQENENN